MVKTIPISVRHEKMIDSIDHLIRSIISEFNLAMARPDQVKKDCDKLRLLNNKSLPDSAPINLEPLFPLLQKRSGLIAEHLFSFLEETSKSQLDPLPFIKAMLSARDKTLALRALEFAVRLAEKGILKVTRSFIQFLNAHSLTVAGSGAGKTTASYFKILQIAPLVKGLWLFDLRKREFAILKPYLARLGIDLIIPRCLAVGWE